MNVLVTILINLALFLVGYLFIGSFNTAIILSNKLKKDDVRKHYSKNAGATNSLRVFGKKFALAVFLIDFAKVLVSVLILAILAQYAFPKTYFISPQSVGLGIVVGHIFPIWFKFKGGKGVACSSALILSINIVAFVIAAFIFFTIAFKRKIVSLASILTAGLLVPFMFIPWMTQGVLGFWINNVAWNDNLKYLSNNWYVSGIIYTLAAILVVAMHHSNIKRLIKKEEKRITSK
ncbi:glycerol-3-phosphate 1-O-acyltransferase PlsY [Mycoplasmopsis iners]|uniref:glycerol-3-phosphate 1-O-acyltransferase PlsY n=1 Tax=Mycoplasmopsis iners TaxID=76630 RepID=UPI00049710E1|nr:glycerol-3-phosphate 1-O-acyltransferase PlsY [Mycoplasmopsis iners]